MPELPRKIVHLRGWILKAENDLKNAEHTLRMPPGECPFDTVCFHAQQVVEKYLKAILVSVDLDFPKSHDLAEIAALLPASLKPPLNLTEFDLLTAHAVLSRYPESPDSLTALDAGKSVEHARRVRDWARSQLPAECLG